MNPPLIVSNSILIDALPERVWEVLITPAFIKQWYDLPEHFGAENLHPGTVIEWPGNSRLSVEVFEPSKKLRLSLYDPRWELPPTQYDIAYTYTLVEENRQTLLTVDMGDFAQIKDGQKYYDASVEFANDATIKIKELAES